MNDTNLLYASRDVSTHYCNNINNATGVDDCAAGNYCIDYS